MSFFLDLSQYDLSQDDISIYSKDFILIEKRNWDYNKAHEFQKECVEYIRHNRNIKIFILCNHPHCFTLGRGLQKNKELKGIELIDFNPELRKRLSIPVYDIKRGGGLTFHYPGQLICYPIVSLGKKLDVYKTMNFILEIAKEVLEKNYDVSDLSYKEKLLGLWQSGKKFASIGVAVSRFVTYHGMALNIISDSVMKKELQNVFPCGLPGDIYTSLEEAKGISNTYDDFWNLFKKQLVSRVLGELSVEQKELVP